MNRLLPALILFNNLLYFPPGVFGQCGYRTSLSSTKDYCIGSSLIVGSPHTLETIVWYKDGQPVDSVKADQALDTNAVTVAGGHGAGSNNNQVHPTGIAVDEGGYLYVTDFDNNRVQKWAVGGSAGVTVAGGNGSGNAPNQLNEPLGLFVDAQSNIYVYDAQNYRIQEWAPGAASGITVVSGTASDSITGDWSIYVDCLGNIYNNYLSGQSIVKYAPGSSTAITVAGGNGVGSGPGQFYEPGYFWLDGNRNIFVDDEVNYRIQKWAPGATTGTTVAGGNGRGDADNQIVQGCVWVDGKDTIWFSDEAANDLRGRIQKWAPGASSGVTIVGPPRNYNDESHAPDDYGPIVMDIHGNLFVSDGPGYRVLEFRRTSSINSSYTPTVPGKYYAVVTDMQGYSVTTDSVIINGSAVGPSSISVTASATSTPVCTPIFFTATATNGGVEPSYQWEVSGVKVGGDSLSYSNNLFANGDQVYCILTTQAGCTGATVADTSNLITLSIDPHGTASVVIDASRTSVCKGDSVSFAATVTNGAAQPAFQWLLNGNLISGDDSATYHSDSLTNGDVITCLIASDDVCGLAKSNSIPIAVSNPPVIAPGQVFTIPYGKSLTLDPVISGDAATWSWTPSTGLSDTAIADPVADPLASMLYTLKVVSPGGCSDAATILVDVYTPLSLPNAFTPNGDGHNDRFYVLGGPAGSVVEELAVFSRWGEMVFRVQDTAPGDPAAGWDGRVHGSPAPTGTYVYMIVMKYTGGTRQSYKGTVVLIR